MDPRLIIMIVGYSLGLALTLALGFFVWVKMKRNALGTIFLLMNLSIAVVEVSMILIAISTTPKLAATASFLNMANIFIVVFMAHWILEVIGISRSRIIPLILIYVAGVSLFIFYLLDPSLFLLPAVPKLYFQYYFEPALWYTIMRAYFAVVVAYFLYELFTAYRAAQDITIRNRLKYVFVGILFGFVTGHFGVFLVYDIPIDPLYSMLFPLYTIPFAYAVIHYQLMDIKIVARRALFYALSVGIVSVLLGFVGFSNNLLVASYPSFPPFVVPLGAALLASALGFFVWFRLKEAETLKYEFIAVVTHKFRTPLTYINLTIENLQAGPDLSQKVTEGLHTIERASVSLVRLLSTLTGVSKYEQITDAYDFKPLSLQDLMKKALSPLENEIKNKHLHLKLAYDSRAIMVNADRPRLLIALKIILENAIVYTPHGGEIMIMIGAKKEMGEIEITDSGIGISREDMPHVFERFYRSSEAKLVTTEGMGIGLYIAKQIIDRHGGAIRVLSQGVNKGSTFTIALKTL